MKMLAAERFFFFYGAQWKMVGEASLWSHTINAGGEPETKIHSGKPSTTTKIDWDVNIRSWMGCICGPLVFACRRWDASYAWRMCLINATRMPKPQNRWCNKRLTNAFNSHNLSCLHQSIESVFDCRCRFIDDPHVCELFCGYMVAYQSSSQQSAMKRLKYDRINPAHALLPMTTMVFNNNDDNNKMRAGTSRSPLSSIDIYI